MPGRWQQQKRPQQAARKPRTGGLGAGCGSASRAGREKRRNGQGQGQGQGQIRCFPLLFQEQIKGPENASTARFDGLCCYQGRSKKTERKAQAAFTARTAALRAFCSSPGPLQHKKQPNGGQPRRSAQCQPEPAMAPGIPPEPKTANGLIGVIDGKNRLRPPMRRCCVQKDPAQNHGKHKSRRQPEQRALAVLVQSLAHVTSRNRGVRLAMTAWADGAAAPH